MAIPLIFSYKFAEGFSVRLGLALDLFPSAWKKNQLENRIFFSLFPLHFQKTSLFLVLFVVNLLFLLKMTDFMVQKLVKVRKKKKWAINQKKKIQLSFSSKIEMSGLGSAWEIPAWTDHYWFGRLDRNLLRQWNQYRKVAWYDTYTYVKHFG